ncbi:MAG: glycoside hydrolase family 76 protein [Solirubrobacteraceae bacterium]
MQLAFARPDGRYRRDRRLHLPGAVAHLWPFARAMVATLDLAGVPNGLVPGFDADAAIDLRLAALERYWDPRGPRPAYASDPPGTPFGGDRYHDDNAWVGLALVQLERMRPGRGRLERAAQLLDFAVSGWDSDPDVPHPGGVFWIEQGRGTGRRNHDRNTVSTAPNAQLALHLSELGAIRALPPGATAPDRMYAWVNATLDAGARGPAQAGSGLFWDKLRGDGTLDRALWSYNQGSMVGLNLALARRGIGNVDYLGRAEAIARRALAHYAGGGYERQPPAFNAIFFRNLLGLHATPAAGSLGPEITAAMRDYADRAWRQRDSCDRVRICGRPASLLDQSAIVSLLALLTWDPADYNKLA